MNTPPVIRTLLRKLLLALLCAGLAGCVVVAVSTRQDSTLPGATAAQGAATLPVPVAFIVHLQGDHTTKFGEDRRFYSPREAPAWAMALSGLAAPEHVLIAGLDERPDMTPEFAEFCRTHPVVDITPAWDRESATFASRIALVGSLLVDFSTLGLIPLPAFTPYRAQFRLTLPVGAGGAASRETSYAFKRRQTLPPLFLIPQGDEYSLFLVPLCQYCGAPTLLDQVDRTDWRIEEKRRLLAQFMRDARPQLEQYARDTQPGGAPSTR